MFRDRIPSRVGIQNVAQRTINQGGTYLAELAIWARWWWIPLGTYGTSGHLSRAIIHAQRATNINYNPPRRLRRPALTQETCLLRPSKERSPSSVADRSVSNDGSTLSHVQLKAHTILGKSSLTVRFVDGHFVESYYPTIENTFSKVIKYKGQEYATEIIDTAGQVRYMCSDIGPEV